MFELNTNRLNFNLLIFVASCNLLIYFYLKNDDSNINENKLQFLLIEIMSSAIFASTLGIIHIRKKDYNKEIKNKLNEIYFLLEINCKQSDKNIIDLSDESDNEQSDDNIIDLSDDKIIETNQRITNKHINEFIELLSVASIGTKINNHDLINLKKNVIAKIKSTNVKLEH
jgi:hypothetical protein